LYSDKSVFYTLTLQHEIRSNTADGLALIIGEKVKIKVITSTSYLFTSLPSITGIWRSVPSWNPAICGWR